jgi:hypothetical protein
LKEKKDDYLQRSKNLLNFSKNQVVYERIIWLKFSAAKTKQTQQKQLRWIPFLTAFKATLFLTAEQNCILCLLRSG